MGPPAGRFGGVRALAGCGELVGFGSGKERFDVVGALDVPRTSRRITFFRSLRVYRIVLYPRLPEGARNEHHTEPEEGDGYPEIPTHTRETARARVSFHASPQPLERGLPLADCHWTPPTPDWGAS